MKQTEPLVKTSHITAILKLDQQQLLNPNENRKSKLHENSSEISTGNNSLNSSRTTMSSADDIGSDDSSAALPPASSTDLSLINSSSKLSLKQKLKKNKSNEFRQTQLAATSSSLSAYEPNSNRDNFSIQTFSFYRWQINVDSIVRLFIVV